MADRKSKVLTVMRPQLIATTFRASSDSMQNIRFYNVILALAYGGQAVVLAFIAHGTLVPISANYLTEDSLQSAAQGKRVLALGTHHLFDINLLWLVLTALGLAAVANIFIATRYRARYEADLQQERATLRWLQYTVTSSLIVLVLSLVSGIQDGALLLAVLAGSAAFHLGCLCIERLHVPGKPMGRLLYAIGLMIGISSIAGMAVYVLAALRYAQGAPGYIYWLMASMFIAFVLLVGNFILQRKKWGKWADYVFGERIFMAVALVAQSLLAWQVYAGMLH